MNDPQSWRELLARMTPIMWLRAAAIVATPLAFLLGAVIR